jgi:hypothetical protein
MKYLCLIYADEAAWQSLSTAESEAMVAEYRAFTESVTRSGQFVGGNRLEPVATAATVRVRNGKVSTTDGPFAETKEQLAGYYLVDARDFNDAIQIASRIPGARLGSIEVRPVAPSHLNPPAGG